MTTDTHQDPRCEACDTTLVRAGATCPACDHDEHFEGAQRTAPPISSSWVLGAAPKVSVRP